MAGIGSECVKALDDHRTNLCHASTAHGHLQAAGLTLASTVFQVKASLQTYEDSLVQAVIKFDGRPTALESRVTSLETALGGLRGRAELLECTADANKHHAQKNLEEQTREIWAIQHFLRSIRGVTDHLTELQARFHTLEGPNARPGVALDPSADYKVCLQSVEHKPAHLERVRHAGHSATLSAPDAPATPPKLPEAEACMHATAEQCVRQH